MSSPNLAKYAKDILIAPLGGVGEFGMNLTVYRFGKQIFVVDAGIMFADDTKLGVDAIINDVGPMFERLGTPTAYLITHGHEDHVGGVPFLLKRFPAPVYGTPWTMDILRGKLEQHFLDGEADIHVVKPGSQTTFGKVTVNWVPVTHSIPDCCMLILQNSNHSILHTGDFKIDNAPPFEDPPDLKSIRKLAPQGVDLFVVDSTNSGAPGRCPSESSVRQPIQKLIKNHPGRVLVSTFASNFTRLRTIIEIARKLNRPMYASGRGLFQTLDRAHRLYGFQFGDVRFLEDQDTVSIEKDALIMLSGCQGEKRAALTRMIYGEHGKLDVVPGDMLLHSARIIPGNERWVYGMFSEFIRQDGIVISGRHHSNIHVSGHAYQEDIEDLIKAARPKVMLPVHGTHQQLLTNCELGTSNRVKQVIRAENGQVFCLKSGTLTKVDEVETTSSFIDSFSKITMDYDTLRERLSVGESGLAVVGGCYDLKKKRWLETPHIMTRGLGLPEYLERDRWIASISDDIKRCASTYKGQVAGELQEQIRIKVRRRLAEMYIKKPIVMVNMSILGTN